MTTFAKKNDSDTMKLCILIKFIMNRIHISVKLMKC